jgi:hypothetical protein
MSSIARRSTILKAIERTLREFEDPLITTGLGYSARRYLGEAWSEAEMSREARRRLTILRNKLLEAKG